MKAFTWMNHWQGPLIIVADTVEAAREFVKNDPKWAYDGYRGVICGEREGYGKGGAWYIDEAPGVGDIPGVVFCSETGG